MAKSYTTKLGEGTQITVGDEPDGTRSVIISKDVVIDGERRTVRIVGRVEFVPDALQELMNSGAMDNYYSVVHEAITALSASDVSPLN